MDYICEDCGKKQTIKHTKKPNIDTGKLLCQKCSCKYTNKRQSKRDKNSLTVKTQWGNGVFKRTIF